MRRAVSRVLAENAPSSALVLEFWQAARIGSVKGDRRAANLPSPTQPNCPAQPTRARQNSHQFERRARECRPYRKDTRPGWGRFYPGEDATCHRLRRESRYYSPIARADLPCRVWNFALYRLGASLEATSIIEEID